MQQPEFDYNNFNRLFRLFKYFIINVSLKIEPSILRLYLIEIHFLFDNVFCNKLGAYKL
jgi:hypothetical protein